MTINNIELTDFRNYVSAEAEFSDGVNVITGTNAQGKTNLLEAVYMLSAGKSFRSRYDREIIRIGSEIAEIKANINAQGRNQTIKIVMARGRKKQISRNGAKIRTGELAGNMSVVLFSPDDLYLIKDGASARRRLMDAAISQLRPGYAALISEYARLYEHKTRILKDWREKPSLLDTFDDFSQKMCACSAKIIRYRASFVKKLSPLAAAVHYDFSDGKEDLSLEYKTVSTVTDSLDSCEKIFEEVSAHQASHKRAELESQSCLTGIHKDDMEICINGMPARSYASQGQTRTAALSLKLAEREMHLAETGEHPILLLDDVLSELDAGRQEFVLNRIKGGQILITCCETGDIASRTGGRVLTVSAGKITEV